MSQRLRKAAEVLKFWLDRLKREGKLHRLLRASTLNENKEMEDKEIQVNMTEEDSANKEALAAKKGNNKKLEPVKSAGHLKIVTISLKRMITRRASILKTQKSKVFERRQTIFRGNLNVNVTTAKPFLFNTAKGKIEGSKHANTCYKLLIEIQGINTEVKIRMVSIKLLLKTLSSIYYEKAANSKDSKIIENQTLIEYLYDNFFNKYGIASLTEKKVKEILITLKSQKHIQKLKLLAKFLCLYDSKA
jgi:hypothetical protein